MTRIRLIFSTFLLGLTMPLSHGGHASDECKSKRTSIELFGIPDQVPIDRLEQKYADYLIDMKEWVWDIRQTYMDGSAESKPFEYLKRLKVDESFKNDDFPDEPDNYWDREVVALKLIMPTFSGSGKTKLRVFLGNKCSSVKNCEIWREITDLEGTTLEKGRDRQKYFQTLVLYALALNARENNCGDIAAKYAEEIEDNIRSLSLKLYDLPELTLIREELSEYITPP